jgi:hypothetical protein
MNLLDNGVLFIFILFAMSANGQETKKETLTESVQHTEQEARMVLPGIQALFGFQLIAVFNQGFKSLSGLEQALHLAALILITFAAACAMTQASFHRLVHPGIITEKLVNVGTRFLSRAMFFLMLGIVLDVYVVARVVTEEYIVSALCAAVVLSVFTYCWYIYPLRNK